jgi:hypothetical protein
MGSYISKEEFEQFQPRYQAPIRIEGFEIKDRIDNIEKNIQEVKVDLEKLMKRIKT